MKQMLLAVAASFVMFTAGAADLTWLTSLPDAQAKAKADNKLVLMDFTGSDWCPPCKNLHKTVLESPEFAEYASKNLVLVELDFPRRKAQSDELKSANKALAAKYGIEGYPTIIVLSADGKELYRKVGYGGTPAEEYITTLSKAVGK